MKLYYEDEPHILDNISKEEEDYLFSTRGQKIAKLNAIKNKYMNQNNFHMGGKYRDYVERMRKDETLVLDMHGKNISHLVLKTGRLMSKDMLDKAAWLQEVEHLDGEDLINAQHERKKMIAARGRRNKNIKEGKKVNASMKYPPSALRYRMPKQIDEGIK